ncbi:FAD/NAD(P)-binding protein [Archangium violaceum]|uniref:FAD/NAD(P)-binding protein n=1 Tax=Archangium violaceum TaxID=83451 RepID=UPI0019512D7E|nr:FAD/NAD(P)-binding protein [Archangium violaceum]QRN95577.1 FAD/NAD(P)-binding protein [Archangium violaceum]
MERRWDVVVVGGGASGTLLAAQLLRGAREPLRVALLERTGRVGPGLAYSTESPSHLLNVPAGRMSAFPDDPEHFLRWLRRVEPGTGPGDFAQRRRYGQYLEDVLHEARRDAAPGVDLELLSGEVVSIAQEGDSVRVALEGGPVLEARTAVLAVGNALPSDLSVEDGGLYASPRYIRSPWLEGSLERVGPQDAVLLVGTGLTMVDTVLSLVERGHQGRIHALSRHGLLPHVHRPAAARTFVELREPPRIRSLLRTLRQEARFAREDDDWRGVVDALRPHTASLWRGLSEPERRRFLRHLRSFWEVHRHRMAPAVGEVLERLQRAGVLSIHAARVRSFRPVDPGVEVRFRRRGLVHEDTLLVQHVINCTGPDGTIARAHPLLRGLLASGHVRADALGLGLATDPGGALLDAEGEPSSVLFTLGPLRRGELWETTAIPEIRMQALALARRLLEQRASSSRSRDTGPFPLPPPFP